MMVGVVTTKPKLEQWKNDRKDQTDKNIARAEKEIELLKPQPLEDTAPPRGDRSDSHGAVPGQ